MRSRLRVPVPALSLLAAVLTAAGASAAPPGSPWGPGWFPNVELTTHEGRVVRFYDDLLKGKAVAINVIYSRCAGVCPLETAKLVQLQRLFGDRVGKDIFIYSISIDPERDTPEVLKAYAERFHAGAGWLFLTGRKEDVLLLSGKLGLTSVTDASNPDGHLPILLVGHEPSGRWMRNSGMDNPQFLERTISRFLGWPARTPGPRYAALREVAPVERGAYLFASRCSACHTIGRGDGVGPDLAGVTVRRQRAWVERYITEPDKVLAERDPVAVSLLARYRDVRMPNLSLEPADAAVLLSHIELQGRAPPSPVPTAAGP